ncbi:ABC transporter permease [uncultured Psychroserpens sp.]|uniref:ABC transporter permease n=1 Tax=uncultured Psychroserpens sp. TaxID=255436 RepID=UPI0026258E41|nr:ABC transporter permease [uncultured Psychroserpens sp.]
MIRNYIKIAFRNFWRNKLNSVINLVGLSLGLTACILIAMYVSHEKSYDRFHKDADRIFSLIGKMKYGEHSVEMSRQSPIVAEQLKENDPNVIASLRYYEGSTPISIKTDIASNEIFFENGLSGTDGNFFSFFSFDLLRGNPESVFDIPFSVVITDLMAERYFGKVSPIGKQIQLKQDSVYQFTVSGVMKSTPTNSSIKGGLITSVETLSLMKETTSITQSKLFQGGSFITYVKLNDINKAVAVGQTAVRLNQQGSPDSKNKYFLRPFTEIHSYETNTGRFDYLKVFPLVALLILILALTNYVSLTTAKAVTRAKEVGVRKINGASRKTLAIQFYIESTIFVTVSFIIGLLISFGLKDSFADLLSIKIGTDFFFNPMFLLTLIVLLILVIIVSGIYPAIVLSGFKPVDNFKNKLQKNTGAIAIRKTFTIFQFTIAVLLIICGIVMKSQLDFMRNKDSGLQRSNIVMVPLNKNMKTNAKAFRNEIKKIPEVTQTTAAQFKMYGGYNMFFTSMPDSDKDYTIITFSVDEHFIETLGVSWHIKPENVSSFSTDNKIIVNQKTITELGIHENPIGKKLSFGNQFYEIVGVVKDFNYQSLETPIQPFAFFMLSETSADENLIGLDNSCLYVKYAENTALPKLLGKIETTYKNFDSESPFTYEFMDDAFDKLYKSEEQLSFIFYISIMLSLFIAGFGLFGLISFTSEQRIKEIGIRKVLGASIAQIVLLLSKDFIKLVLIAIVIALPLAWYFADSWLSYFAFKITIPWWAFVLSAMIAIILSIVTLSLQSIKVAVRNPVDSLKTE